MSKYTIIDTKIKDGFEPIAVLENKKKAYWFKTFKEAKRFVRIRKEYKNGR